MKILDIIRGFVGGWRRLALAGLVLVLMASAACASRNGQPVSPEGTLALRANQFVQALRTTITPAGTSPIEQLVASRVITAQEAVDATLVVRQTLVYAQDLGALLAVVDNAKTAAERSEGLAKASVLLQKAADGLASATLKIGTESGRKAIVDTLRLASQALLLVGSVFPSGQQGADAAAALAAAGF